MKSILLTLKIVFISLATVPFMVVSLYGQSNAIRNFSGSAWTIKPFERKAFIENKGQFGKILAENKKDFNYCIDKGYQVFFYNNEIDYRFTTFAKPKWGLLSKFQSKEKREEREHQLKTETQFVNVKWLNANPNATIVVEEKQNTSYPYFIAEGKEEAHTLMCDGYSKLTYKNLYNGVDVEYVFHPEQGIEYTLLIHPGADISQIKMQYSGTKKMFLKENDIHVVTIAGDIVDHAPLTFYSNNNNKISSSFNIENNIVSFNISSYSKNQEIVIDPWTVIPGFTPPKVLDNGVDGSGNIYIYGGSPGNLVVEKYASTGGAAIFSITNILNPGPFGYTYYGDLLVENTGNFYIAEALDNTNGAHVQKFSPTASPIWTSTASVTAMLEYWRLAVNCVTGKVIVAGGGINYNLNIAEIDATTGVMSNVKALNAPDDIAGLCVGENGNSYTHGAMSNKVSFNDPTNIPLSTASSGYGQSEAGAGYGAFVTNGYNMMALGGTTFLFTSDGETVKKWDINTYALLGSATITGGTPNMGSGILSDKCNNVFVGASNGVHRFDFNLVEKEFHATPAAVYDIAYSLSTDIIASGDGFLTSIPFGRETCGSNTILIANTNPCNPAINSVTVRPNQGTPPFTFFWDDGNTDSIRTNLSIGNHVVAVRYGTCYPSVTIDTVKILGNTNALSVQKTNPTCSLNANGNIVITLLHGQQITNATWTPSVTNSLLNDSTTKASGLPNGTYSCHLVSSFGCSFDTTVTLTAVNINPIASFQDAEVCKGSAMSFTDNSLAIGGSIASWSWNFGDNSAVSTIQMPSHPYTNAGTYSVRLIVTDNNGCQDTTQKNIIVHPVPSVKYNATNACKGSIVPFTDLSSIPGPDIIQIWSWSFGDGTPVNNNQNPVHLYQSLGTYSSKLVVTSDFGCKDSVVKTIIINPNPTVNFTAPDTMGCSPLCINFQNLVNISSGTIAHYSWDFGDGTTLGQSPNPEHCYTNTSVTVPKTFNVILTATSDSGCVSTFSKNNYIIVNPNPISNFSVQPNKTSIINPVISFVNLSSGATVWKWNFGDTATSTIQSPASHSYADTGKYQITLIVSNQYSCFDTSHQIIRIEPDWAFFVPNAFTPNGDGINDHFQGYGYGLLDYQMMIFDRWGNQIYYTERYDLPWDGRANHGTDVAQEDVYVYVINIKDIKKMTHAYRGIVTLVR